MVYVKTGPRFEAKEIKVLHRTESKVAIEGLAEGTEVAAADPEQNNNRPSKAAPPMPAGGRP
jgi:hypothetical protein